MKKLLSLALATIMLFSVAIVSVSAEESAELTEVELIELKLRQADANKDGTYSTEDAAEVLRAAAGVVPDGEDFDFTGDGSTTVDDAIKMLRILSGMDTVITEEETLTLFNSKLNGCKADKPGFSKVATAQCRSMKISQDVEASNSFVGALLGDMKFTDLEYDKYVEKMISMMDTDDLSEEEKEQIEEMRESAETYKDPQYQYATVEANDYYDHYKYFPREYNNVSSTLTIDDISSIKYTMLNGNICFYLTMPKTSYGTNAYPSDDSTIPYGKVFNLVDFGTSDGSVVNNITFNNGKITMYVDSVTGAVKEVNYSYDYSSDITAPPQTQSDATLGSITVTVRTKTSASIKEDFVF